jgi:hypothetical protein
MFACALRAETVHTRIYQIALEAVATRQRVARSCFLVATGHRVFEYENKYAPVGVKLPSRGGFGRGQRIGW